jgi:transcriptional regulator with XRE-family HTH domain
MEINSIVASKIREIRKELDWSSESVAMKLGITKGAYSNLENGKVEVTVAKIEILSKIFNKPMASFLPNIGSVTQINNGEGNNVNCVTYNDNKNTELINNLEKIIQETVKALRNI